MVLDAPAFDGNKLGIVTHGHPKNHELSGAEGRRSQDFFPNCGFGIGSQCLGDCWKGWPV